MSLIEKLMKDSKIDDTELLSSSKIFDKKEMCPTDIPMLNMALSGDFSGGLMPGLLTLAGPSKHFKSAFALIMAAAYQKKHPDGVVIFYDSEFGSPQEYFHKFGVDPDRVIHKPISNAEEFSFDVVNLLNKTITKEDNVCIVVDSIGNLASIKEITDAENEKSTADMSRAKKFKSIFRMVTPKLILKSVPMILINHVYQEIGSMYPKDVVGGGTGLYYSSNDIWIIGRRQEKEGTEVQGYNFTIKIEKSRTLRETSKLPIQVTFDGGVNKWSGMLDLAIEMGELQQKGGWYRIPGDDKSMRATDLDDSFWENLLQNKTFTDKVKRKFSLINDDKANDRKHDEEEKEVIDD